MGRALKPGNRWRGSDCLLAVDRSVAVGAPLRRYTNARRSSVGERRLPHGNRRSQTSQGCKWRTINPSKSGPVSGGFVEVDNGLGAVRSGCIDTVAASLVTLELGFPL